MIKIGVNTLGICLSAMSGSSQAALADVYDAGSISGYYIPYEGLLAGFMRASWYLDGSSEKTPIVQMSIESEVQPVSFIPIPTTIYNYDDVMAVNSDFTAEEQVKLSRIGYLMANWITSSNAIISDTAPPTTCAHDYQTCSWGAGLMNALVWNIWNPGSVSLTTPPFESASLETLYAEYTSGAYDYMNWSNVMAIQNISGGVGLQAVPLGGFILPGGSVEAITTVPVPAAAWLFGSGLLGLIGVARRKKAA